MLRTSLRLAVCTLCAAATCTVGLLVAPAASASDCSPGRHTDPGVGVPCVSPAPLLVARLVDNLGRKL